MGTSIKYYRPRGIVSLDSFYRSTLIKANGVPNVNPNNLYCFDELNVELNVKKKPLLVSFSSPFLGVGFQHRFPIKKPFIWKITKNFIYKYTNYQSHQQSDTIKPAPIEEPEKLTADVVVVGGGLAGLSAALETVRKGLKTILIDDQIALGGRARFDYYKPYGFKSPLNEFVKELIKEVENSEIQVLTSTVLNGFWEDGVVAYKINEPGGGKLYYLDSKLFILATGSLELPSIFENNDLPGIITPSTALRLVNEYNVDIGESVALIGLTDYSARVAVQLADRGMKVVILTRESPFSDLLPDTVEELKKRNLDFIEKVREVRALGKDRVKLLVVETSNGERKISVNTVLHGALENSNFKLAAQAGVEIKFFPKLGYIPVHSESMETNVDNVLVAGGVTGSPYDVLRLYEGRIAGLTASIKLSKGGEEEREQILVEYTDLLKKLGLAEYKDRVFKYYKTGVSEDSRVEEVPSLYSKNFSGKKFICFCEDITLKDLHKTVKEVGFEKMQLIKRYTGISTGACQGRLCLINASLITSMITNKDPNEVGLITQRTPVIPIPFRMFSEVD